MSIPPRSGRSNVVDIRIAFLHTSSLQPRPAFTLSLQASAARGNHSQTQVPPTARTWRREGRLGVKVPCDLSR